MYTMTGVWVPYSVQSLLYWIVTSISLTSTNNNKFALISKSANDNLDNEGHNLARI